MRTPTEKQYGTLLTLGSGNMVISGGSRELRALVKRGWLTTDPPDSDNGFRITVDGLRALALAVEKYGLPKIGKPPKKPTPTPLAQARTERDEERRRAEQAQVHWLQQKLKRVREAAA